MLCTLVETGVSDMSGRPWDFARTVLSSTYGRPLRISTSGSTKSGAMVIRLKCVRLQSCDDDVRTIVERRWMARFPGLLNDRMSGQIWLTAICSKPPKIPGNTAYMRRYYFNVGGF